MIAACDAAPPESTTTAAHRWNSGVHDGFVHGQTSTSSASSLPNSAGSRMTLTVPVAVPALAGVPDTSASPRSRCGKTEAGSSSCTPTSSCRLADLRITASWSRAWAASPIASRSPIASSSSSRRWNTSSVSFSTAASRRRAPICRGLRGGSVAASSGGSGCLPGMRRRTAPRRSSAASGHVAADCGAWGGRVAPQRLLGAIDARRRFRGQHLD